MLFSGEKMGSSVSLTTRKGRHIDGDRTMESEELRGNPGPHSGHNFAHPESIPSTTLVAPSFPSSSLDETLSHRQPKGSPLDTGMRRGFLTFTGIGSTAWLYPFLAILNAREVAASIDFDTLIAESRRLSMSGVLGLLEADILFAEPGTSQPEFWRLVQGILGIGSLRVLGRICKSPCFEKLHLVHGIKPPESVQAREFWLQQESWPEIHILDMGREETSYHRINQGSGPQGKLLRNSKDIITERDFWGAESTGDSGVTETARQDTPTSELEEEKPKPAWVGVKTSIPVPTEDRQEISEGSTDKWWMDRWQIEALAVASARDLSLQDACNLLTTAYFGASTGRLQQRLAALFCVILTVGTFLAAWYTNWSWISQFFALSCLGYFVNWTACLRAWRFVPSDAARDFKPKILKSWPTEHEGGAIRIATQSSGIARLRGLIPIPEDILSAAIREAKVKEGRYKTPRKTIVRKEPYAYRSPRVEDHWISFESQASFYGVLVSVEPDNVTQRSIGVLWAILNGLLLLILGFGASIQKHWSGYVLLVYLAGIALALYARRREAVWTLPEFAAVDFTTKHLDIPPTVRARVMGMPGAESLTIEKRKRSRFFSFARSKKIQTQVESGPV